jgi:DNA polymerase IV (DinB-like DNA polymerase)
MKILQDTAKKYNGKFEQVGIDEAYLKVSGSDPDTLAKNIKDAIFKQEKITASVGVGPNMLIAKIASDFNKPNGLTVIKPDQVQKFLDPMNIRKLPGIGPKTESELNNLNIKTIADLRKLPQSVLYEKFGEHGISLYDSARGIDERIVTCEHEAKSISEEHTFSTDTSSAQEILPVLFSLVKNVILNTKHENYQSFKTVTVKIRYSDFKTHTKSLSGNYNLENPDHIEKTALKLLWPFISSNKKIRLIGFRVSRFC